jgi:cobalt-zinc-cadmium efflux system outer membrane protein
VSITGLALLGTCLCAHAQEWTERAVLDVFDSQSPVLREARAAAAAIAEEVRGRTLWPNPEAIYSRETVGFTEFFQAEQRLPVSGRMSFARRAMEPARAAVEAQGAARAWDMRASLRASFYRALAEQERAEVVQASIRQMEDILELLRVREREGEGSRYDRMRVDQEAAALRADLAMTAANARGERAVLLSYLPVRTEIAAVRGSLAALPVALTQPELIQQAFGNRAELRAEDSRLAQFTFERQAANRLRIPEPMVTAGWKRTGLLNNRTGDGAVIGVSVPLPLFSKGRTEVARLSAEQERARARRDLIEQQVAAAVAGAYDVHRMRLDALRAFEEASAEPGEQLLETARVGYEEGELGILELLDAYRLQRQTQMRRLDLQAAVKQAEIELSRGAGFEVTQ